MKALLCHCKSFRSAVKRLADRPFGIRPGQVLSGITEEQNFILVLVTVEANDRAEKTSVGLASEIRKMLRDTGRQTVIIMPFAHLSSDLADTVMASETFKLLELEMAAERVSVQHFGSDKALSLALYGHKGSVRYRSFQ